MLTGGINLTSLVTSYMFTLIRISSLFVSAPFYSSKTLPVRIKIILAILLTIIITPLTTQSSLPNPNSISGLLLIVQQILIGVTIGLIFQFIFHIIIVAGQIIAMQSGLGFASFVDPSNQEALPIISEFYLIVTLLVFLSSNGHIFLITLIYKSFTLIPLSETTQLNFSYFEIVRYFGDIFAGALSVAIPAIVAMLIVNITLAIMTKAAPQLNIFTIGFPLMLLIGLFIMYINFSDVVSQTNEILSSGYKDTLDLLGISNG